MLRSAFLLSLFMPCILHAQEVCDNGTDDDGDGLIDLNDPDCPCSSIIGTAGTVSYFPNPSFEDRVMGPNGLACPFHYSSAGYDAFECLEDWHMATGATSDYFNMCGFAPPTFPMPPPDGEGAVGFISVPGYREYVGATISTTPLHAGTAYTLSLWTAGLSISETSFLDEAYNMGVVSAGAFPLALFGNTQALPFPLFPSNLDCIGWQPGWVELGRVEFQPANEWLHVSITFTPTQDIKTVLIGSACDLPDTFQPFAGTITTPGGVVPMTYYPYTMVDDLILTEAGDQAVTPVSSTGDVCQENVALTALPPNSAIDHQWYLNGVAIPGQTATTMNASGLGLEGGIYTLASTYDGQCLMGSVSVWQPAKPDPALALVPASGCAPLSVAFADTTVQDVTSSVWTYGDGDTDEGRNTEHLYTDPGTYDITLTVTTVDGCTADTLLPAAITVHGSPVADMDITPNPTDADHTVITLSGTSEDGVTSWWWDLGDVPPQTFDEPSLAVTFPSEPGLYPVMLVVTNAFGCPDTVRSFVEITPVGEVRMPNVFSPNGDGSNDRFVPLDLTDVSGEMDIYNRWGQLVYNTGALATGWDGKIGGTPAPAGTYYYVVKSLAGEDEPQAGHLTLVR